MTQLIIGVERPPVSFPQYFGDRLVLKDTTNRYHDFSGKEFWDTEIEEASRNASLLQIKNPIHFNPETMMNWFCLIFTADGFKNFNYDRLKFVYTVFEKLREMKRVIVEPLFFGPPEKQVSFHYGIFGAVEDLEYLDFIGYSIGQSANYNSFDNQNLYKRPIEVQRILFAHLKQLTDESVRRRNQFDNYVRPI